MGKLNLPIMDYKESILTAVANNSVVIIQAETGAGKSTQVPQFLVEAGYKVVVTQPRRLAAKAVAQRVAEEIGCSLGTQVGYRTAYERKDSALTQLLFCTDGLQLVRELTGNGQAQVLVIDEIHEWNINMEVLIAWSRLQISQGWPVKVVIMSATLETKSLVRYYYGCDTAVINVPGRVFNVDVSEIRTFIYEYDIRNLTEDFVKQGKNVQIFLPGKSEIYRMIKELQLANDIDAVFLPLHGELEPDDQAKCFLKYAKPKVVVCTNIAQTSVTIPDMDVVLDTGEERRKELVNGIESLVVRPISQADCEQRKGRTGRTGKGLYILYSDIPINKRPAFSTPEIQRSRLDQVVLRLAANGYDATQLGFYHQPDQKVLKDAKQILQFLGAMTDTGQVTDIGKLMSKLPVSVEFARMIVEADRLGVVDDVVTIAAILETGSIRDKSANWREHTQENQSDLLAELDLWKAAQGYPGKKLSELGIIRKTYFQVRDLREKLIQNLKGLVHFGTTGNREDIKRACVTGMLNSVYNHVFATTYEKGSSSTWRELERNTVVTGRPSLVVGVPINLGIGTSSSDRTFKLLTMVTAVDLNLLKEIAPHLLKIEEELDPYYSPVYDSCASRTEVFFDGRKILNEHVATPEYKDALQLFAEFLAKSMVSLDSKAEQYVLYPLFERNNNLIRHAHELNNKAGKIVFPQWSKKELTDWLVLQLKGAKCVREIDDIRSLYLGNLNSGMIKQLLEINHPVLKDWLVLQMKGEKTAKEIVSVKELFLPELDPEMVKSVLDEDPENIVFEGQNLVIGYYTNLSPHCPPPWTTVNESFARSTKSEAVVLPNGRTVNLVCGSCIGKTFPELVESLEEMRISQCRYALGQNSWAYDPQDILPYLPKLLTKVEITRTNNGKGKPIFGYFALEAYKGSLDQPSVFRVIVYDSLSDAEEVTKIELEELIKRVCHDALTVQREGPWQEKSASTWYFTPAGKQLTDALDEISRKYISKVTPENFFEKVEQIKAASISARLKFGGDYEAIKLYITQRQNEANKIIGSIPNSSFVYMEIEQIQFKFREAGNLLSAGEPERSKAVCDEAYEIACGLKELYVARTNKKKESEVAFKKIKKDLQALSNGEKPFQAAFPHESNQASHLLRKISEAFYDFNFYDSRLSEVKELIKEAEQLIELFEKRHTQFKELMAAQYSICPACGCKLPNTHQCDSSSLRELPNSEKIVLKRSSVAGQQLVSLSAVFVDQNQIQIRREANPSLLFEYPDDEIITESIWRESSEEELKLINQINELKNKVEPVAQERSKPNRVEVTFKNSKDNRGNPQLRAEGILPQSAENEKKGLSDYENQPAIFVCHSNCHWLKARPRAEQTWVCTIGYQIAASGNKPVIIVNPQLQIEAGLADKLAELEAKLNALRQNANCAII